MTFTVYSTLRPTVEAMENLMYKPFKVLDHGSLTLIDYMGDEESIVNNARTSYGKGTRTVSENTALIRYLYRHSHTTPIESLNIRFNVVMPIFVARQWVRHRMATISEYSARYSILAKEFYLPSPEVLCAQAKNNKQGREHEAVPVEHAHKVLEILKQDALNNYAHYEELLNEDQEGNVIDPEGIGIARELARMNLTLNYYTTWNWTIDLHNLLHFLSLRCDAHAQYEIRVYADIMLDIVKAWCPNLHQAFKDYNFRQNARTFSAQEIAMLKSMLCSCSVPFRPDNITKREWTEFVKVLGLNNA